MPRGGKRPNSGPAKGAIYAPTLSKAKARELLREQFVKDLPDFYLAQKAQALGTKYLVTRDPKTGKFVPLDEAATKLMLDCGQGHAIEVWDRPPSTPAFVSLWDRALDKPSEHIELTGEDGGPVKYIDVLQRSRKRAADRS